MSSDTSLHVRHAFAMACVFSACEGRFIPSYRVCTGKTEDSESLRALGCAAHNLKAVFKTKGLAEAQSSAIEQCAASSGCAAWIASSCMWTGSRGSCPRTSSGAAFRTLVMRSSDRSSSICSSCSTTVRTAIIDATGLVVVAAPPTTHCCCTSRVHADDTYWGSTTGWTLQVCTTLYCRYIQAPDSGYQERRLLCQEM